MRSAADFIQILQRRAQLQAHRLPPPGEFPSGWSQWFAAMELRPGQVTGAPADDIVEHLAARAPAAPPPRAAAVNRWQAFASLWRQQWQPADVEDRRVRMFAATSSLLWHVLVGATLLWLMYAQFLVPAPSQGETVVQVEYIGVGAPEETGGGEPSPTPDPGAAAEPAAAVEPAAVVPPAIAVQPPDVSPRGLEATLPDVPQRDVPEPVTPSVAVEQPVAVSEPTPTSEPDAFVLPPPRPRVAEVQLATPELQAPVRELQAVEVPEPVQPIQRSLPQVNVAPRPVEARMPEVTVREVPTPLQPPPVREVPTPALAVPRLPEVRAAVRERSVAAPKPAAAVASAAPGRPADARPAVAASAPAAIDAASPAQRTPTAASPGAGPNAAPAPGAWPSPRRSDDWGDSARNLPGAQAGQGPGLFDSDGSVRVVEAPGSASPGQPPGTVTQEIASLDRAGTWLKRKPTDFEASTFDRYWRPHETLLQEWVRKSIKRVLIPIPGSTKSLVCDVSLLALGGGCGISDPNLNEQPATARPPPDIPFKPHLQEDNGSVKPAG
ncbi:hypothetical protein ACFFGH_07810 [Lysobacter korlensis]|uniref:Transmembrane repetitive protein n=1 Tax=Lysobacter korlensis TaxID=553636 RepID=A0ABV6RMY8_9GAMM